MGSIYFKHFQAVYSESLGYIVLYGLSEGGSVYEWIPDRQEWMRVGG